MKLCRTVTDDRQLFYALIKENNFSNLARKKCRKASGSKGGNQFFKFGFGKKRGGTKIFPNPRGRGPKPCTLCFTTGISMIVANRLSGIMGMR